MKVRAIAPGFYGGKRRRVDDEFDVPDKAKSKWFEPADKAKPKGKPKADEKAPQTLSELARIEQTEQGEARA